jgi:hypothetical protein
MSENAIWNTKENVRIYARKHVRIDADRMPDAMTKYISEGMSDKIFE